MFTARSRYRHLPAVEARAADGRAVQALKLRRLPEPGGEARQVRDGEQLDVLSLHRYDDGARFWHIADANTELEANALVRTTGRRIDVPDKR